MTKRLTYDYCDVCAGIKRVGALAPIRDSYIPVRSAATSTGAPFHSWYHFVLGFDPSFVDYIIKTRKIGTASTVLDPFCGSGTTLVECKMQGMESVGIDANDFMYFASRVKTAWDTSRGEILEVSNAAIKLASERVTAMIGTSQKSLLDFSPSHSEKYDTSHLSLSPSIAPYFSPAPARCLLVLKEAIDETSKNASDPARSALMLAFASILMPASNLRFGPTPSFIKPKETVDIIRLFKRKIGMMIDDLASVQKNGTKTFPRSRVILGDAREMGSEIETTVQHIITSPPYPGDHEYTKFTRLELGFLGMASTIDELRDIKKRMIRGSTRNIYTTDNEAASVDHVPEIHSIIEKIRRRVDEQKGTSGFEKSYAKVAGEYFGGMRVALKQMHGVLDKGGTASILVGDSHAFKMVHIETAKLLGIIAKEIGFTVNKIECWQHKASTMHEFYLPENILYLVKK